MENQSDEVNQIMMEISKENQAIESQIENLSIKVGVNKIISQTFEFMEKGQKDIEKQLIEAISKAEDIVPLIFFCKGPYNALNHSYFDSLVWFAMDNGIDIKQSDRSDSTVQDITLWILQLQEKDTKDIKRRPNELEESVTKIMKLIKYFGVTYKEEGFYFENEKI